MKDLCDLVLVCCQAMPHIASGWGLGPHVSSLGTAFGLSQREEDALTYPGDNVAAFHLEG